MQVSLIDETGHAYEIGWIQDGLAVGTWTRTDRDGTLRAEARFDEDGRKHGKWLIYDPTGALHYELEYEHGVRTMARKYAAGELVSYRVQ